MTSARRGRYAAAASAAVAIWVAVVASAVAAVVPRWRMRFGEMAAALAVT